MTSPGTSGTHHDGASEGLGARIRGAYWPAPSRSRSVDANAEPDIIPPEGRKAAMVSLDPGETRWAFGALLLTLAAGVAIPAYITAQNKVTKAGKNSIAVAPDAWLLGGALVALSLLGLVVLWKRRRTLIAFDLFLIGFGFTLFIGLAGFAFILLGGWLMLRAWRINKYGTTNSKAIARQAATRTARSGPQGHGFGEIVDLVEDLRASVPQAARGQQALHPQVTSSSEGPQALRITDPTDEQVGARPGQRAGGGSTSSAERRSWSTSARRRTKERAVGSSPRARSTSTSVTIPITVE